MAEEDEQSSLKRYMPIILLVLLVQTGAAYYLIDRYLLPMEDNRVGIEKETIRSRKIPDEDDSRASVDLDEIITNARGENAKLLIRTTITLVLSPDAAKNEIKNEVNHVRTRDAVIWALGNATSSQLKNPEGRVKVKDLIKKRINGFLYEGQVVDAYFRTFTLQAMAGYRNE